MSEGHHSARSYPIWLLFVEAEEVVTRQNRQAAQNADLMYMTFAAAQGGKKAFNQFKKRIDALTS